MMGNATKIAIVPINSNVGKRLGHSIINPELIRHHMLLNKISIKEKITTLMIYSIVLFLIFLVMAIHQSITGKK